MIAALSTSDRVSRIRAALRARESALHGRDVLGHAIRYAALGLPVFPCRARSKEPAGWLASRGVLEATTDELTIRRWFRDETLNLAIAGGDAAVIVDIDPRNGGDDELATLERTHGPLPETPRVLTGRGDGGLHYYFRASEGARIRNGAIATGLDLKARGGYVVAPPSIHPDTGQPYRWDLGAHFEDTPIAPLPEWIAKLATEKARSPVRPSSGTDARLSVLGQIFERCGVLGDVMSDGRRLVRCPWASQHSDKRGFGRDSSTVLFPATEGSALGGFHCSHAHCAHRTGLDVLDATPLHVRNAAERALATMIRDGAS